MKQLDISPHVRPREASVASVCVPCGDHFAQREENDLLISLNSFLLCYVCVQWGLSSRCVGTGHYWAAGDFAAPVEFISHVDVGAFFTSKLVYWETEDTVGLVHRSRMFVVHSLHAFVEFPEWGTAFVFRKGQVGAGGGAVVHDVVDFRIVDVVSQVSTNALFFIAP